MDDDGDDTAGELFNNDFDDAEPATQVGVRRRLCPKCNKSMDYRVEGRFVIRNCPDCGHEEED